jgi:hypothetical protein
MPKIFQAAWQALFGRDEPPKPLAPAPKIEYFQPTFLNPVGYGPNGYQNPFINPDYFATRETAEWICKRFGAREVFERVAPGNQGPFFTVSEKELWIRFDDGTEMNAGLLASIFVRNPEDKFPGLAESMVWQNIAVARQAQKNNPIPA